MKLFKLVTDLFKGNKSMTLPDFCRNDYPVSIVLAGATYPTVEHAFQASKTNDKLLKEKIRTAETASEAKQIGNALTLIPNWGSKRVEVMTYLIRQKFFSNAELQKKLIEYTEPLVMVDDTDWFWGQKNGEGLDNLGKILTAIRDEALFVFGEPQFDVEIEPQIENVLREVFEDISISHGLGLEKLLISYLETHPAEMPEIRSVITQAMADHLADISSEMDDADDPEQVKADANYLMGQITKLVSKDKQDALNKILQDVTSSSSRDFVKSHLDP
jgi:ribA/ribD-fused uncharacterized protein